MLSTMQDYPLSIGTIMRQGTTFHGSGGEVVTWSPGGPRRRSYAEVGARAARLAHALREELGVTDDQRVATFQWNNAEHLETYLAVPSMGAVLHTLNIRLFPEQLTYIANHAADHVVVVDNTLVPLLGKLLPDMTTVKHVVVCGEADLAPLKAPGKEIHSYEELIADRPDSFDWPVIDERQAAAMCYTSGTTGNPKGVAYSHRSIYLHSAQVCMGDGFGLSQADRVLAVVPMFHAMAWGLPYAALMVGASQIMPDRFLQAEPLAKMIESEHVTFAGAVPTIWTDLLHYLDAHPTDLSSLREVVVGGSACPPALMHAFQERHGVEIVHAWGMTEMSPLGSVCRPPAGLDVDTAWSYRYSQGRLPAGVEGRMVGPDGSVLPNDGKSVGELQVRGPWVAASYYGDDQPDPEKFHDGWLRTGDVGTLSADGFLRLTDRAKDVIKSGGEWISSVELENLLMAHPAVVEASVVGIPDEKWGERPLATVVGAALDPLGRRRIAGLRALADELGWYFAARDDRWVKRLEGPPFRYGPRPGALSDRARHRRARNVLTGQWGGRAAVAFDYSVRTVTSAGFGQAATADLRFAVCAIELPEPTPRLDIIAAPRFTRAARLAGRAGVELENEDFNRTFHVVCGSGRFASDVLQPRTMRRLLDDPCGTIRLAGHHAQIHRRGRLRPTDVTRCLGLLGDVVSGIPAFVWADLRTGAGAEDVR